MVLVIEGTLTMVIAMVKVVVMTVTVIVTVIVVVVVATVMVVLLVAMTLEDDVSGDTIALWHIRTKQTQVILGNKVLYHYVSIS